METKLCLLILEAFYVLLLCFGIKSQQEWGYIEGTLTPNRWAKNTDKEYFCDGWQQSPIDIDTKSVVYFPSLKPPMFTQPKPITGKVKIKNDGHKISAEFPTNTIKIEMDGSTSLCAVHVHWHWGSKDAQGSEHTVDGKSSPIEAHVVTYDCNKFASVGDAVSRPMGLAVFGFFYEITEDTTKASPALTAVTDALKASKMKQAPSYDDSVSVDIKMFDISELMPKRLYDFYRYMGSLTTPYCTENVLWTVFKEKAFITREQMDLFRSLKYPNSQKALVDNYRPVQPLNPTKSRMAYRVVASSFSAAPGISTNGIYITSSLIFVIMSSMKSSVY